MKTITKRLDMIKQEQ